MVTLIVVENAVLLDGVLEIQREEVQTTVSNRVNLTTRYKALRLTYHKHPSS